MKTKFQILVSIGLLWVSGLLFAGKAEFEAAMVEKANFVVAMNAEEWRKAPISVRLEEEFRKQFKRHSSMEIVTSIPGTSDSTASIQELYFSIYAPDGQKNTSAEFRSVWNNNSPVKALLWGRVTKPSSVAEVEAEMKKHLASLIAQGKANPTETVTRSAYRGVPLFATRIDPKARGTVAYLDGGREFFAGSEVQVKAAIDRFLDHKPCANTPEMARLFSVMSLSGRQIYMACVLSDEDRDSLRKKQQKAMNHPQGGGLLATLLVYVTELQGIALELRAEGDKLGGGISFLMPTAEAASKLNNNAIAPLIPMAQMMLNGQVRGSLDVTRNLQCTTIGSVARLSSFLSLKDLEILIHPSTNAKRTK